MFNSIMSVLILVWDSFCSAIRKRVEFLPVSNKFKGMKNRIALHGKYSGINSHYNFKLLN